ncbi:ABC transporter substrate-binding protein [Myceligenerans indicum]|uniref:Extracellular solute-binding protein n=1 Tax=Myceligenerans indicum TaxID=2593663 RepID=A0ABS1LIH8_9MICO|nr:extracellular solute-binding protein [Myceligenerans indicum]MBL0885949.1 extracellular solute-binding protein [Myceligenerans indicum]
MRTTTWSVRAAAAAGTLALTVGLAACGTAEGSGGTELSGGDVDLRVTWWGGDARHERTQEAIDAFEEKHPNIHVTGEFADWTGYWDKLATSTAGGNSPDVIQMDQLYLASYADRGALADLGALPQLTTSGLDDPVLGMGRSGDTLYGMPVSTTAFGLLVNQDVLADLGIELPDTDTWTWDEFDAFARSVSEKSGGRTVGITPWNNEYSLQLAARQAGDELFADGDVAIDPATLEQYFQRALDWTKDGAAQSASQFAEQASASLDQQDFATGKTAMIFSQVTQLTAYAAAAGGANVTIAALPADGADGSGYQYLKPGMYWSVSARSAHPAEAALFVDFMVNDPQAGAILGTERGLPANPEILASIADGLTDDEKKAVDYSDSLAPQLGDAPEIVPNGASETDTLILRYLQDVLFEERTPAEAAEGFIDELRSAVDAAK